MDVIYTLIKTTETDENKIDYAQSIRQEFNNIIDKDIYNSSNIYENMYKKFKTIIKNTNNVYVNFSSDCAISSASISALNELYSYRYGEIYKSDLKIIYISSSANLELNNYDNIDKITQKIASKSVISNLISMSTDDIKRSYTKHMLDLELSQFIFIGLEELTHFEENLFLKTKTKYYMINNLYKNIEKILDNIVKDNKNNPIAIIFDLNSIHSKINLNQSEINNTDKKNLGINMDQINIIINKLSNLNIKMLDITGYDLYFKETNKIDNAIQININFIMKIYGELLKLKEYSLNIFTENSRFLIYKRVEDIKESEESGYKYGWYILRNIKHDIKQKLLESFEEDSIIIIDITDDDNKETEIMISTTCVNEQNNKCYYMSTSYSDCCLYPDEKLDMVFEMINNY